MLFQQVVVLKAGTPMIFDREDLRQRMQSGDVHIEVNLHGGAGRARAWGCDLSKAYVDINTCYN